MATGYEYSMNLPSDCEREPIYPDQTGIGFSRAEMDYIHQEISHAVEDALKRMEELRTIELDVLAKSITDTKSSNVDVVRNVALQLAITVHTQDDAPLRRVEIVETARAFHSFMKGWEA